MSPIPTTLQLSPLKFMCACFSIDIQAHHFLLSFPPLNLPMYPMYCTWSLKFMVSISFIVDLCLCVCD